MGFESWQDYDAFAQAVRYRARFTATPKTRRFVKNVLETSVQRKTTIPAGKRFWRAQLGHSYRTILQEGAEFEIPGPHDVSRMTPHQFSAREGRVNVKGIPCLYLATDSTTAMSEVRPWLGELVSVARFEVSRELSVVNCSRFAQTPLINTLDYYFSEPGPQEREAAVWAGIDRAFSEPTNAGEFFADYAPTQVLAEHFRKYGYDGVVYKSLLADGFNIALFNLSDARITSCHLHETEKVSYKFRECANPYFVKKDLPAKVGRSKRSEKMK